jgi:hypothetical protein
MARPLASVYCAPRLCVLTLKRRASRGVAEAAAEPRGEAPSERAAARCGRRSLAGRASSERGAQYRPGQLPFSRCSFHRSTWGEEAARVSIGVSALCRTARQSPRHAGAHSASQTQAVPLRIAAWQTAARAASQRRSSGARSGGNAPTRWGRWSGRRRHTSGTPGPRRPSPWRTWRAARRSARQRRVPASRLSPALGFAAPLVRARTCGTHCSACSSSWPDSPSGSARRTETSSPAQARKRVRTERRCEPAGGSAAPRCCASPPPAPEVQQRRAASAAGCADNGAARAGAAPKFGARVGASRPLHAPPPPPPPPQEPPPQPRAPPRPPPPPSPPRTQRGAAATTWRCLPAPGTQRRVSNEAQQQLAAQHTHLERARSGALMCRLCPSFCAACCSGDARRRLLRAQSGGACSFDDGACVIHTRAN